MSTAKALLASVAAALLIVSPAFATPVSAVATADAIAQASAANTTDTSASARQRQTQNQSGLNSQGQSGTNSQGGQNQGQSGTNTNSGDNNHSTSEALGLALGAANVAIVGCMGTTELLNGYLVSWTDVKGRVCAAQVAAQLIASGNVNAGTYLAKQAGLIDADAYDDTMVKALNVDQENQFKKLQMLAGSPATVQPDSSEVEHRLSMIESRLSAIHSK